MIIKKLVFALPVACSVLICLHVNLLVNGSIGFGFTVLGLAVLTWISAIAVSIVCFTHKYTVHGISGLVLSFLGVPVLSLLLLIGIMLSVSPLERDRLLASWNQGWANYAFRNEALKGNTLKASTNPLTLEHKAVTPPTLVENELAKAFQISKDYCQTALWSPDGASVVLHCKAAYSEELILVQLIPEVSALDRVTIPLGSQMQLIGSDFALFDHNSEQILFLDPKNLSVQAAFSTPKCEVLIAHPECKFAVLTCQDKRARLIDVKKREQVRFLTMEELKEAPRTEPSGNRSSKVEVINYRAGIFSTNGKYFRLGDYFFEVAENDLVLLDTAPKDKLDFDPNPRTPQDSTSGNGYRKVAFESASGFFRVSGKSLQIRGEGDEYLSSKWSPISLSTFADLGVVESGGSDRGILLIMPPK